MINIKKEMNKLLQKCYEEEKDYKKIIAAAVSLGMKYQEDKIKDGINIVFEEINKRN